MPSITRSAIVAALAGVVATGISFASPAHSAELLINNYLPPKHPFQTGIQAPWAEAVVKATNGAVTPKFSNAAVGPPPKNWQTVSKGVADVVLLANVFQTQRIQLPTVAQMPLNSPGALKTSIAMWKAHEQYFAKADEYKGNKILGSFVLPPNMIYSREKPIRTLADLEGFKMRVSPGMTVKVLKDLGGVPVASGPSKVFSLVSKGVVDGSAIGGHGLRSFRIVPYIKYATLVPGGISNTTFSFLMNGKKWDGLTKEQQDQVMSVSGIKLSERLGAGDKSAEGGHAAIKANGAEFVEPAPDLLAKLKEVGEREEAEWLKMADAKGVDGKAALAFFKSQLK